jgi:hypothetical protein
MAVKTAAKAAAEAPTFQIELHPYARIVWRGVVYEEGVVYDCESKEQMEEFLSYRLEGINAFRKYVEPTTELVQVKPTPVPRARAVAGSTAAVTPKGMEIGTKEEEAELGLDKLTPEGSTTEV